MMRLPLLMVMFHLSVVLMEESDFRYTYTCHMNTTRLTCASDLPDPSKIPEGITSVVVQHYKWFNLTDRRHIFKHQRWKTIRELYFMKTESLNLFDEDFISLVNLEKLAIQDSGLQMITHNALAGLHKLCVLELSGCSNLESIYVIDALLRSQSRFTLEKLNLNYLGQPDNRIFAFNYNFSSVLHHRTVKQLSMRGTHIRFKEIKRYHTPSLLEYIDFSDCNIYYINRLKILRFKDAFNIFDQSFKYLRILNVGGIQFDNSLPIYEGADLCQTKQVAFASLQILEASRMFKAKWIFTKMLNIRCVLNLKRFYFNSNHLYILNATIYWPIQIEFIDLSSNDMEQLSSRTLQGLAFLKHLDLSSNLLFNMEHHFEFPHLFLNLKSLEYLNLGNNSLTSLPVTMFENNSNLRILILSNNKLMSVSYIPTTLTHMTLLDLQNNMISHFVETYFNILNTVIDSVKFTTGKTMVLNLRDNTIVCDCETLDFLLWIVNKLQTTRTINHTCSLDGRMVYIDEISLNASKYNCYKNLIITTSTTISVATTFALSLIVYLLYDKRRKSQRQTKVQKLLKKLLKQNNKFLVFISYSSDDVEFVKEVLEPAIKSQLKNKFDVPNKFIVTGDSNFRLGYPIVSEIMRCIQFSCVVVCFVSKSFCESDWCETELREAVQQHKPTILLFKDDINRENMSRFVRMIFNRYTRAKLERKDNMYVPIGGWDHFCESVVNLLSERFKHFDSHAKEKYKRQTNKTRNKKQYNSDEEEVNEETAFI